MKITTKTGDRGETSLFGGRRVSKSSDFICLIGELDELQAVTGWARCGLSGEMALATDRIQDDLYRIMSVVGFEMKCPGNIRPIDDNDVEFLEKEMKKYEKAVGDLSKFIRPGTTEAAARLQIARTVCRRVERGMVGVDGESVKVPAEIIKYLNRLSDLLFVMAYSQERFSK